MIRGNKVKMQFLSFFIAITIFVSCVQLCPANVKQDCDNLRARCEICVRVIHEGPNEDNILGRLNHECRQKVGQVVVWRDVKRCEIAAIRCKTLDQNLTCELIAKVAGMQRRLP